MTAPILSIVPAEPTVEPVLFRAGAAKLLGELHHPGGPPRAAIVFHGATGVRRRFYRPFAQWLATQGFACFIYDYRDLGDSRRKPLRASTTTMAHWGIEDQPAAQRVIKAAYPDTPIWAMGHSLGGLMLPFQPDARHLDRVITVASGLVHLRDHPWPYRATAAFFWFGPPRWARNLMGYLPAKALRIGPDLPGPAYDQWRRWCTTNGFYLGDVGRALPVPDWQAVTAPMKIVTIEDDVMCPPATAWRLMQMFPNARKRQLVLKPSHYDLNAIGHIRVFAPKNAALWPDLIA